MEPAAELPAGAVLGLYISVYERARTGRFPTVEEIRTDTRDAKYKKRATPDLMSVG